MASKKLKGKRKLKEKHLEKLKGLKKRTARYIIKAAGMASRIICNDGTVTMGTAEVNKNRVQLILEKGKVVDAKIG